MIDYNSCQYLMEEEIFVFQAVEPSQQKYFKSLNQISCILEGYPAPLDPHIRKYVATYIQARSKSQEFFLILCQHNIFERILSKNVNNMVHLQQCTCLLQCINLLMSNTKITNQIVYYLSQGSLHEYLFNLNILKEPADFIEYYIQLLKTMLIKLSETDHSKSFIKLFCNERYPSFPIFQFCLVLATYKQNQLVRVTAQQCVLILVGLINEYTIFQPYLYEIGLVTMIAKLIIAAQQRMEKQSQQQMHNNFDQVQEVCKYIVDLIYQLRENRIPLLLINNLICNLIIMRNIPKNFENSLKFIVSLSSNLCQRIQEHQKELEQPIIDNLLIICVVHLRVLCKLTINYYLSGSIIGTFINVNSAPLSEIDSEMFPNEYYQCKNLIEILGSCKINFIPEYQTENIHSPGRKSKIQIKQRSKSESQLDTDLITRIISMTEDFERSKQINKLKESYDKKIQVGKVGRQAQKNQSIFSFLFKKTDWIKKIMMMSGIDQIKGGLISKTFPKCFTPQTGAFISQYANINQIIDHGCKFRDFKFGQHGSTCEHSQIYHNFIHPHIKFTKPTLNLLIILAEQYRIFERQSLEGLSFESSFFMEQHTVISRLYVPYYSFLVIHFKEYLSARLNQLVIPSPQNKQLINDVQSVVLLTKLCQKLGVKINQQRYRHKGKLVEFDICYKKLIEEMRVINQYVQTCIYQGDLKKIGSEYWRVRKNLLEDIDGEDIQKQINQITVEKKKKKLGHRNRVKSKIEISVSSIKQKKQMIFNKKEKLKTVKQGKKEQYSQDQEDLSLFFTRKMILYECLQSILSPKLKKLDEFYSQQWSIQTLQLQFDSQDAFSSVISSQNSLVTVQQVIKQYTISYFGKTDCKLCFVKVYYPPTIILIISLHNKNFVELQIQKIVDIKENKIDKKVLQIVTKNKNNSYNIEAIRTYNQDQAQKLILNFKQCKDMQNAALSNAIFSYLSDTYSELMKERSFEEKKEKRSKKIQIIQQNSMHYPYQKKKKFNDTFDEKTPGEY